MRRWLGRRTGVIEQAKDAFETAVRQGVDLKRTPCIYYPNAPDGINTWFALVVFPDDESPRAAAIAAGCPGARKLGYVALNESGEVVDVRLDPVAGSAIESTSTAMPSIAPITAQHPGQVEEPDLEVHPHDPCEHACGQEDDRDEREQLHDVVRPLSDAGDEEVE